MEIQAYLSCHKIEVAYQEAVALKRKEELISEEEAQWWVESEQKARQGTTTDKEKKSKKKQTMSNNNDDSTKFPEHVIDPNVLEDINRSYIDKEKDSDQVNEKTSGKKSNVKKSAKKRTVQTSTDIVQNIMTRLQKNVVVEDSGIKKGKKRKSHSVSTQNSPTPNTRRRKRALSPVREKKRPLPVALKKKSSSDAATRKKRALSTVREKKQRLIKNVQSYNSNDESEDSDSENEEYNISEHVYSVNSTEGGSQQESEGASEDAFIAEIRSKKRNDRSLVNIKVTDSTEIQKMTNPVTKMIKSKTDHAIVVHKGDTVFEISDDDEKKVKLNVLTERINPRNLIPHLQNIPESHKSEIRKIGFGAFLDLDLAPHKSNFCVKLVKSIDVDSLNMLMANGDKIDLKKVDFQLVYGLPNEGNEIEEPENEDDEKWNKFLSWWRGLFGLTNGSPHLKMVLEHFDRLKNEDCSKEFLLHFVIAVVNCCICSTTNLQLNYKFLYSCMNMEDIGKLNWCSFAYKHLFKSVGEWQLGQSFFTGPLTFLLFFYFDRIQRGLVENPRTVPLISVWKKERIIKRMDQEKKFGFLKGTILKRTEVEQNVKPEEVPPRAEVENIPEVEEGSSNSPNDMLKFVDKFQKLAKTLAGNVKSMHVMLKKANSLFDDGEICLEINNLFKNILSKYDKRKNANQSDEVVEGVTEQASGNEKDKVVVDKDDFYDDVYFAEFDAFVLKWCAEKKKEKSLKKYVRGISPPSFNLLSPSSTPQDAAGLQIACPSSSGAPIGGLEHENVTPINLQEQTERANADAEKNEMSNERANTPNATSKSNEKGLEDINPKFNDGDVNDTYIDAEANDDVVNVRRERRIIGKLPPNPRSPFMVQSERFLENINTARRRAVEFAFSDCDPSEVLYYEEVTMINRDDVWSLRGKEDVVSNILDAFSAILNNANMRRSPGFVNRFFFTTVPMVYMISESGLPANLTPEQKIDYIFQRMRYEMSAAHIKNLDDFNLVFFPVHSSAHFYLFVINNVVKTVDVIDNMLLPRGITFASKYGESVKNLLSLYMTFVKELNPNSSKNYTSYATRLLKMKWRSKENYVDCGVFALKHMELYFGQNDAE